MNDQAYCKGVAGAIADYLWQEMSLHPKKGDYRIQSAVSGPRVLALGLLINPRHATRVSGMAEQLSMAAGLDRKASIRVARGNRGTLMLEVPKPDSLWYNVGIRSLPRRSGMNAPVGIDVEHRLTSIDLASPLTPHILAAGTTGSGKTNTARLVVYDLAVQNRPEDIRMILVDTRKKGIAWRPFAQLPHLAHSIIVDEGEALRALSWAVAEMDRRAVDGRHSPRVFISVDEAQALLERDEFVGLIGDIAAVGREFGIHIMLVTQNPTAEMMGSTAIKRNMTTRLVGKVDSASAATVAAGIGGTGAELLTGPGDQLLVGPSGVRRVTAALVTEKDTGRLPRVEVVGGLDLEGYDDVGHVREQANVKAAPLEPEHLAWALAYPDESQRAMYDRFHIGFPRIKRAQSFAAEVAESLGELGFYICNGATVQQA